VSYLAILLNKKLITFGLMFIISITIFSEGNMKQKALQLLRKEYSNQKTYENLVKMYENQYRNFSEYLSEEEYWEGVYNFPKGENIFLTKVYDTKKIEEAIKKAEATINSIFVELSFVMKDSNGNWSATFYYKDSSGGSRSNSGNLRKTITNKENNFTVGGEVFNLIVGENNKPTLTVIHKKSGVKKVLEQKNTR